MKNNARIRNFCCLVFILLCSIQGSSVALDLTKIEVFNEDLSTQMKLMFSKACDFKLDKDAKNLKLSVFLKDVDQVSDKNEIKELLKNGLIKQVNCEKVNNPQPGIRFNFVFSNPDVYVKLVPLDEKTTLVIEIYSLKALEKIKINASGPLLYAANSASSFSSDKKKTPHQSLRIVLDPGHGGEKLGAQGLCNLVEKDIVLDIAKKTKALLEQAGFNVYLTRESDKDISLLDRSRLAQKLKADLFLSIHANSAGNSSSPQGIETFCLNAAPFSNTHQGGDSLLVPGKNGESFRILVHELARKKDSLSHHLAQNIQNNLITVLNQYGCGAIDRGVKRAFFNVLLRGSFPSALVEVGFITNYEEASRLAQEEYRKLIAYALCCGVQQFLTQEVNNETRA